MNLNRRHFAQAALGLMAGGGGSGWTTLKLKRSAAPIFLMILISLAEYSGMRIRDNFVTASSLKLLTIRGVIPASAL